MKNSKDISAIFEAIEKQNSRIGGIEQLLKMLLVNNVLTELDDITIESKETVDEEIVELIIQEGLIIGEYELINEMRVLYVVIPQDLKIPVSKIMSLKKACSKVNESLLLGFYFEQLSGIQRKRLFEEQISFCVKGKEVHIFPNKKK